MTKWLPFFVLMAVFVSCLTLGTSFKLLPPGIWRGVLILSDAEDVFDEKSKGELPFNFEVIYDTADSFHIVIHNGDERIIVDDIRLGIDRRSGRDTLWIDFPIYDSHIQAQYEEDAIEGWWVVRNRKDYKIRFIAKHGQEYRFFQLPEPPAADLSGTWECHFGIEGEKPDTSIGDFKQVGNKLTGTFMNITGDDRFLEGTVSGDRMFLSVFDGTHAYLYEAKILADGQLSGIYRSGNHFKTYWDAIRNDTLELTDLGDAHSLTAPKNSDIPFSISLPDPDGNKITLEEPPYAGKSKIIQIMGTWCPNCRDETKFLLDYLKRNPSPGFEIIGISFERHDDPEKAKDAIRTYKTKMDIPYTILYGGSNDKQEASAVLPMLNEVIAFPTLIFLDKDNKIISTHTGFSGPATKDYNRFIEDFDQQVKKITSPDE